jgi:anti-sigma-K factor RskA
MKTDLALKVQAYLDGELEPGDQREVERLLADQPEARDLLAELTSTRSALNGNEPQVALTESRDFYWSQIQRRIEFEEKQAARPKPMAHKWSFRRLLAPIVTGAACLFALAIGLIKYQQNTTLWSPVEIETMSEDSTSMSFRSPSEKMFVVWVYDRNEEVAAPAPTETTSHD